jgi:DNA-binding LytR/AlgR family response regulator
MRQRHFDGLAIAGIFLAYFATIRLAMHATVVESLIAAAANTVPVVIFGAVVRRVIQRQLVGRPAALQLIAHLPLCAAFSFLSYGLLIVLLGLSNGIAATGFMVKPLSITAGAWQTLENVTTYAFIAAISYLQAGHRHYAVALAAPAEAMREVSTSEPGPLTVQSEARQQAAEAVPPREALEREPKDARTDSDRSRFFVRIGDELRPIDMDTVVSIGGADDYAEVWTLSGRHLVRVTLAEFTQSLDPAKYARVHRSWIVNILRIARAEPAGGGRLLLHMETGQTISTSRSGARLLRDRVI